MEKYLITGATGYIGSLIATEVLKQGNQATLIVRNKQKLKPRLKEHVDAIEADIRERDFINKVTTSIDHIIHCAAITQSAYMIAHPVEVADTIINGTRNILELAKKTHVKSMVYLSSMEVYGKIDCSNGKRISEEQLGDIDLLETRSCYPMAKRMAENYCYLYYKEYGVPVKIARLAQTFGRDISKEDNRVFAQFANAVCRQKDIILHTKGNSVGNYCDVDDAVNGILFLLLNGESGEAYNIVNEANTMTIREMAEMVARKIANNQIGIKYDIPEDNLFGYATETGLRLSGERMKLLGWEATTSLEEMYRRLIDTRINC